MCTHMRTLNYLCSSVVSPKSDLCGSCPFPIQKQAADVPQYALTC